MTIRWYVYSQVIQSTSNIKMFSKYIFYILFWDNENHTCNASISRQQCKIQWNFWQFDKFERRGKFATASL